MSQNNNIPTHLKDEEILAIHRQGNTSYAFHLLVEKYKKTLYFYIRRIVISHDDTDDVLQNTLLNGWKGLSKFRQDASLYTWLYRIATNESLKFLKRKNRFLFIPLQSGEYNLVEKLEGEVFIDGTEIQKKLQKAILNLPNKQRLVFNMRYFEELSFRDISQILNTSEGGLKANYHHAVKKIEEFLSEY